MTLGKSYYVSEALFFSSVKCSWESGQFLKEPVKIKWESVQNEINLFENGWALADLCEGFPFFFFFLKETAGCHPPGNSLPFWPT